MSLPLLPLYEVPGKLSVVDGLLVCGESVVIPAPFHRSMINIAHESCLGITRTKADSETYIGGLPWNVMLRKQFAPPMFVSWYTRASNITCCAATLAFPRPVMAQASNDPFGRFEHPSHFSKLLEVSLCMGVTAKTVTKFLLSVFARESYPDILVLGNGPLFTWK